MVLVDNLADAKLVRDLRDNGKTNDHDIPGTNSKMSESDCAQLLVKLKYFNQWQRRRAEIADYYSRELDQYVYIPKVTDGTEHAWHKYVIKCTDRRALQHHLSITGIETKVHYEKPLYEYSVGYPYINYASELYREASAFCTECLSLPIYPELTDAEVERVVEEVKEFFY
jgi:dTDP-4-amino-4,6-dideoxygalactose transaminase